ncbi:MAG: DEAD/DEAH box helicase [Alcanivoracaceae bacterium]|nr:DEAD/DEAH box helicase [Alcanivoracaceae bacterium]
MKFSSLGLAPEILQALDACGYKKMTPVQEKAMVPARRGKDLYVHAQTGTGKTAAFALPVLQQIIDKGQVNTDESTKSPQALILTPTRELAEQLAKTIGAYAQFLPFSITALYGGVKMGGQANKLKAGVDILISTPGRLIEHLASNNVSLAKVEYVVLDEADRMLDMGFITDVTNIIEHTAKKHQTLLFSATTTPAMNELSHKILKSHQEIRVSKINTTAETVEHVMYPVEEVRKIDLFMDLLEEYNWFQILVFTSTKRQADTLLETLKKSKIKAGLCHGDKSQGSRRRALADFKSAKLQVLVATEVAARGLDIEGLDFVLNYNLPYLAEDYVHRIGRTGRAGKSGHAISFVSREEERAVNRIQRLIGGEIKRIYRRGYEVGERSTLRKAIAQKPKSRRSNKASETKINRGQIIAAKPKHKKTNKFKGSGKKR